MSEDESANSNNNSSDRSNTVTFLADFDFEGPRSKAARREEIMPNEDNGGEQDERVGVEINNENNDDNESTLNHSGIEHRRKKNRKRRRSKRKSRSFNKSESGTEDDSADADVESNDASPSTSTNQAAMGHYSNAKRNKRKHHSHPKRNVRNGLESQVTGSDSDLHRQNTGECLPTSSGQVHSPVSSVSESEDFEYSNEYKNLYASARLFTRPSGGLRPIAIDGCNVAWGHGNDQEFSWKGIPLCADYFRAKGHRVKAFVPRQYQSLMDSDVVDELIRDEILVFTPSRNPGNQGKRITAYDDRFIVQYAVCTGGVVISNDNFNDLYHEQPSWRETITNRVLQHTWVSKDILMFQLDPLGRKRKQTLDEFLRFP